MRKYSANFERDFKFYMRMRHKFDFDGQMPREIVYDRKGVDGKYAFFRFDSEGKLLPTRHPKLLASLLKTKGSSNFHIKQYAEDRASGLLPLIELRGLCMRFKAPDWFYFAVEAQKNRIWKKDPKMAPFLTFILAQERRHKQGLR